MNTKTTTIDESTLIKQTKNWLNEIIIGLNFCPFAKREVLKNSIRYTINNSAELESSLYALADELQYLDAHSECETSLFICPQGFNDFDEFLNLIELADQLIDDLNYRSVYQLAHFHPDYCFDGVDQDDASNYTNRSPYPTLHILRESSLQSAIARHPDTSAIPETNIALARDKGSAKMQQMLNLCLEIEKED